jgi:ubiquitin carboxyl-terminal hydrolase 10
VQEQVQEKWPEEEQKAEIEAAPQQDATPPPPPESRQQSVPVNPLLLPPVYKMPFYPKLPWFSADGGVATFPKRATDRRRTRPNLDDIDTVTLPAMLPARDAVEEEVSDEQLDAPTSEVSTIAAPSEQETPATSQAPSESDYTQPSPPTPAQATVTSPKVTPKQSQGQHARRDTRTAIAVPNIPGLARARPSPTSAERLQESATPRSEKSAAATTDEQKSEKAETGSAVSEEAAPILPPKDPPKSWADLVRRNVPAAASGVPNGGAVVNGAALPKSASLADALKQYGVQTDARLSFLEPRGLVNTGNMCYMNSVCYVPQSI